jgi:hypothetical protein
MSVSAQACRPSTVPACNGLPAVLRSGPNADQTPVPARGSGLDWRTTFGCDYSNATTPISDKDDKAGETS